MEEKQTKGKPAQTVLNVLSALLSLYSISYAFLDMTC